MKTQIVKVSLENPEYNIIHIAAEILKIGGLVAFPTETVYGLGADAFNPDAVRRVFEAKNRPQDNPLIVHISDYNQLMEITDFIPEVGKIITNAFWPGPLTIVVKASKFIPTVVTGGMETVAVRMPKNKVALKLIDSLGKPIVGPSANLSGKPSPTTAEHVYQDLNGKIDLILDAGPTEIGVESTVVDITVQPPLILRFGGLTREKIEQLIGDVETTEDLKYIRRSPGTRYRHYAPEAKVVLVERGDALTFNRLVQKYIDEGFKVGYIVYSDEIKPDKNLVGKIVSKDIEIYAKELFQSLRDLDMQNVDVILVESVEAKGIGTAIMDRLIKASKP
ncbi:MAG: TsaC protein (YrdC domain) required for threonylcarbamoyladenosine t(6)A37 modification in tRNA [Ignavibacteriae bacterium]|nr:MAG: TsaC protein (YrdC domain) required for threonylcarbamoyladenosine t(6)A37 modification in tRNA [Ignavibacteriota bacterium]